MLWLWLDPGGPIGATATEARRSANGSGSTRRRHGADYRRLKGAEVTTSDGHQVGVVEGIYLDETSHEPEWALVNTPWVGKRDT